MRLWRETHPGVVIETSISPSLGVRGETAELTIYRIIQEALTNVFRHAGATRIEVTVAPATPNPAGPAGMEAIRVSVRDNGAGLPADHKQGFGMLGMRERVLALGGTITVASTHQGVTVEAMVPCGVEPSQHFSPRKPQRDSGFFPDLSTGIFPSTSSGPADPLAFPASEPETTGQKENARR